MTRKIIEILLMVKDQASKAVEKAEKKLNHYGTTGKKSAERVANLEKASNKLRDTQDKLNKAMTGGRAAFQGWAMSLMFAGMALQKMFMGIAKASIATFNDISSSVEGGTTGFQLLEGSVKELQFVIGAALEPVVAILMPIIDMIIDWVSQNQKLTADFIVWGTIIGTILMVLGMVTLAIVNGIIPAVQILMVHFTTLSVFVQGWAILLGTSVLAIFAVIVAAVIVFVAMWKSNFGGIRDFVKGTFGTIWETVKSLFGNIKEIFSGVMTFLDGLFTGDINKIMAGFIKIMLNAISFVIKLFMGLGDIAWNVFAFAFNAIKDLFAGIIKVIIGAINKLIAVANKIPGVNIGMVGTGVLDKIMEFDLGFNDGEAAKERNSAIDALVEKLEAQAIQVVVELDGEKVGEAASKRVNESMSSGSDF